LDADASLFMGGSYDDDYTFTGVASPTLRGEATLLSGLALGGAAGGARAAPCPDFTPPRASGPTCYDVTGYGGPGQFDGGTFLPCAGGLRGLVAAGAGARIGLDGCGVLPRNLTLSARDGGALALASVVVSAEQLDAAYNSLVDEHPGRSLELDAVTVSDLPAAGAVTGTLMGTLSAGADGGWLRDPPGFRPLGGARPRLRRALPTSCTAAVSPRPAQRNSPHCRLARLLPFVYRKHPGFLTIV